MNVQTPFLKYHTWKECQPLLCVSTCQSSPTIPGIDSAEVISTRKERLLFLFLLLVPSAVTRHTQTWFTSAYSCWPSNRYLDWGQSNDLFESLVIRKVLLSFSCLKTNLITHPVFPKCQKPILPLLLGEESKVPGGEGKEQLWQSRYGLDNVHNFIGSNTPINALSGTYI